MVVYPSHCTDDGCPYYREVYDILATKGEALTEEVLKCPFKWCDGTLRIIREENKFSDIPIAERMEMLKNRMNGV